LFNSLESPTNAFFSRQVISPIGFDHDGIKSKTSSKEIKSKENILSLIQKTGFEPIKEEDSQADLSMSLNTPKSFFVPTPKQNQISITASINKSVSNGDFDIMGFQRMKTFEPDRRNLDLVEHILKKSETLNNMDQESLAALRLLK
jgi:hypothetical protein